MADVPERAWPTARHSRDLSSGPAEELGCKGVIVDHVPLPACCAPTCILRRAEHRESGAPDRWEASRRLHAPEMSAKTPVSCRGSVLHEGSSNHHWRE